MRQQQQSPLPTQTRARRPHTQPHPAVLTAQQTLQLILKTVAPVGISAHPASARTGSAPARNAKAKPVVASQIATTILPVSASLRHEMVATTDSVVRMLCAVVSRHAPMT
jgi:hypothetical protein